METSAVVKTTFSPLLIDDALMNLQDYLERASLTYVVLGDVANELYKKRDAYIETDKIEVAVLRRYYTVSGGKMFNEIIMRDDYIDKVESILADNKVRKISYLYKNEVPVIVRVLDKDWSFLQTPDRVFYKFSEFPLPNPFEKYWVSRGLVR
jgi:hypothetical protein